MVHVCDPSVLADANDIYRSNADARKLRLNFTCDGLALHPRGETVLLVRLHATE